MRYKILYIPTAEYIKDIGLKNGKVYILGDKIFNNFTLKRMYELYLDKNLLYEYKEWCEIQNIKSLIIHGHLEIVEIADEDN